MYTLFIDTHDKNVLIILYKDGKIIKKEDILSSNKHSEITMPVIDQVLKASSVDVTDLGQIIVVNGPGSFTGERIAVTIGKTMAYALQIPIRVIDSLTIKALSFSSHRKVVALEDRNGAFIGIFDEENHPLESFKYINKKEYMALKEKESVVVDVNVDYEKVYHYAMQLDPIHPHSVKPLYIKGISALNDR